MKKINLPEWDAPMCPEINNVLNKRDIDTIRYKTMYMYTDDGTGGDTVGLNFEENLDWVQEKDLEGKTIMQAATFMNEVFTEGAEDDNETEWWLQKILCDLYPEKYQAV